jgi:hypothetical protein
MFIYINHSYLHSEIIDIITSVGMTSDLYKTEGGFVRGNIDEFDGKFFGMSPYELEFTE